MSGVPELLKIIESQLATDSACHNPSPALIRACEVITRALGAAAAGVAAVAEVQQILATSYGSNFLLASLEAASSQQGVRTEVDGAVRAFRRQSAGQMGLGNMVAQGDLTGNTVAGGNIKQHISSLSIGRFQVGTGGLVIGALALLLLGVGTGVAGANVVEAASSATIVDMAKGTWACNELRDGKTDPFKVVIGDGVWASVEKWDDRSGVSYAGVWDLKNGELRVRDVQEGGTIGEYVIKNVPTKIEGAPSALASSTTSDHSATATYKDGILTVSVDSHFFRCAKQD